jgi:hypothetical protein
MIGLVVRELAVPDRAIAVVSELAFGKVVKLFVVVGPFAIVVRPLVVGLFEMAAEPFKAFKARLGLIFTHDPRLFLFDSVVKTRV